MNMTRTSSSRSLVSLFVLLILLSADLAIGASAFTSSSPDDVSSSSAEENVAWDSSPILIDGLPPLMCGDEVCSTPERNIQRDGKYAEEEWGWWNAYGPDKDWNGMDDRLQRIISGQFESESPTAEIGPDGRKTVAITIDFAWHPGHEELSAVRQVLFMHGWTGDSIESDITSSDATESATAWWKPMQYLDAIAVDKVPVSALFDLWTLPGVVVIENQNVMHPFLDTASASVLAVDSELYFGEAHTRGYRGDGVVVAVLDTGIDNEHRSLNDFDDQNDEPDLDTSSYDDPKWVAGYDATSSGSRTDGTEDPDDGQGHGSHCAGIAVGTGDSNRINQGTAPGSYLVDIKVLTDAGGTNSQYSYSGIEWMIQNKEKDWGNNASSKGIQVASMSFGTVGSPLNPDDTGDNGSGAEARLVNRAAEEGIVVVIAMGNDGTRRVPSPASADHSIAVAAVNNRGSIDREDDIIASYSNSGPREDDGDDDDWDELKPTVGAPGSGIMSVSAATGSSIPGTPRPMAEDSYEEKDGTSMSTPLVAGLIAVMLSANPTLDHFEIKDIIQNNSELKGTPSETDVNDRWNEDWGYGLANVACYIDVILSLPCDDENSTGGGGGTDPPPTSNGTGDVLEVGGPTNGTWFILGTINRIHGTLNTSGNQTWDHVEARMIRGSSTLVDWTRAGNLENWFIDFSVKESWIDDGNDAWVEIRAIDSTQTSSTSVFVSVRPAKHELSFTSPSGHDPIVGDAVLEGMWEGVEVSAIQLRVDNEEWETLTGISSSTYDDGSWSGTWDSTTTTDGNHRLTVRLLNQSGYVSAEVRRSFNINNVPPTPDLQISGGVQTMVDGLPSSDAFLQQIVEVHADVVNNGDKDVDEVVVRLSTGSQVLEQVVPSMRRGEIHRVVFWNWMPEVIGDVTLTLAIDPTGVYEDSDSSNNYYSFDFTVNERPDEIAIIVRNSGINTNPQIPYPGDGFTMTIRVENVGQQDATGVQINTEEFVEGIGWKSLDESIVGIIPGSTITTSFHSHQIAVGPDLDDSMVRKFRISANVEVENDTTNNQAITFVIFDEVELLGAPTQLDILDDEVPLGYAAADNVGHLLTTRDDELHLRIVSKAFTMPGDTLIESNFAGEAAILSAGDGTTFVVWTRRTISLDGYVLHDVAFTTVDDYGSMAIIQSLTQPLKASEGSYWGLSMARKDEQLVITGYHRDIATAGSYKDVTNVFLLSTTNPTSADNWLFEGGVIQNADISSHVGDSPVVAIGEEKIHILYESMRDDGTGISRVGLFYSHGEIGSSPWSFQAVVGDNASTPQLKVEVIDGKDVLFAGWRDGTGSAARLKYAVTDSAWSIDEPEDYPAPGMSGLSIVSIKDGVQVFFDTVGFLGPEVHYGLMSDEQVGFSTALVEGHFFAADIIEGDTHFLLWSLGGGFYIHSLVDPTSNNENEDSNWNLLNLILDPLPGDRAMQEKIALSLLAVFIVILLMVVIVIKKGKEMETEMVEIVADLNIEKRVNEDIELLENEIKVAIDLDAEVVEVSSLPAYDPDEEEISLADSLKEAAQQDGASNRLKRRMARLQKSENEAILADLPPLELPPLELPPLELPPSPGGISSDAPMPLPLPPLPSQSQLPPLPGLPPSPSELGLPPLADGPGTLPLPSLPALPTLEIERQANCTDCEIHFTVKDSNLKRVPCPMCGNNLEL
ncbi:MAG: S8 family serine peptidase [Euryarchaeota archaeon]|nr:S8 family serine peptidase [Euryarchaeota archaeon]